MCTLAQERIQSGALVIVRHFEQFYTRRYILLVIGGSNSGRVAEDGGSPKGSPKFSSTQGHRALP